MEAIRRNSFYQNDFRKFKKLLKGNPVVALKKFKVKWGISPLDPALSFDEILERWEKGVRLGYKPKPFPIEILYRKGEHIFLYMFLPCGLHGSTSPLIQERQRQRYFRRLREY